MRKVFWEDLPKWSGYNSKNINWQKSIGHKINFIYDSIEGEFSIEDYDKKDYKVLIKYLNNIFWIPSKCLKGNNISNVLGLIDHSNYLVGDIIEIGNTTIKILESNRDKYGKKTYKCKCLKCGNIWSIDNKSIRDKVKCTNCSKNIFIISKDETYWIGFTQKNDEFWFNGDDETIEYIKSNTWRKNHYGYFQNKKGEKLHRVVMGVTNPSIFVNHLGGNKFDCRKEMLSISNCVDNSREKKISSRNSTGIVGLLKRGKSNKYVGNIKPNGIDLYSKYKEKNEALIDLLIMQKHYGFRHNQDLWYMLDDVSEDRVKEVLDNCKRQMQKKRSHSIKTNNKIELSEDKSFYWVYDSNNNKFKIGLEAKDILSKGIWYVAKDKNEGMKSYVKGSVIVNGMRKSVKLHRFLMDLLDVKYKKWFIDHINGDGLDNRFENLIITNAKGNGHKSNSKGYSERKDLKVDNHYRVAMTLGGIHYDKTFSSEEDAIEYVDKIKLNFFNNRLHFKNKKELDEYIKNK